MSQISQLEAEIQSCQEKIRQLREKQEKLEEARRQNGVIANTTGEHVSSRRNYANNFHQYNQKTTISKLIAKKLEENYSRTEEVSLLNNYDGIDDELRKAIQRAQEEIDAQNDAIRAKQHRIDEIREEERRERERREQEQREREQRAR